MYYNGLSKYIAPEGRCTVQYRVTSDNGITSGDESAQRATSDAIGTSDPVLDSTSLIWGDVLVIHYENTTICDVLPTTRDVLNNTSRMVHYIDVCVL